MFGLFFILKNLNKLRRVASMNNTSAIGSLALDRLKELKDKQQNAECVSSIELQLPLAVEKLNTGTDFWRRAKRNRYLKLLRDGEITLDEMQMLAEMASRKEVNNPAGW